ncbi:MAG TPA: flagellar biosynthetic protein FliR [Symbiobacteriaceae bacterium]|nr:flagellar biosynthetic protein FliR [Symbiobacteriaceae bacterium]
MEELLSQLPVLLLVSSRVAGVTTVSPVFSNRLILPQMRVAFTFLLALIMLPVVTAPVAAADGAGLLFAVVQEIAVGLVIGFMSQLVFAAVQMAGAIMDADFGLSMAQTFDPVTNRSEPLIGAFMQTLALVVFFALNAHLWLIKALAESYQAIPAGSLGLSPEGPMHVAATFGVMLTVAVKMVLPFMAAMMISTAVLAGINRAVQHMQIFQAGLGIKAVLGLGLLVLMLPFFLGALESLFSGGHTELLQTLEIFR